MSALMLSLMELLIAAAVLIGFWTVVRRGKSWGESGGGARHLQLLERLQLEQRRSVYLVRAGEKVFVIGASEAGLCKLGVVPEGQLRPAGEPASPAPFLGHGWARVAGLWARRAPGPAPALPGQALPPKVVDLGERDA